jgi:hypothetical protein
MFRPRRRLSAAVLGALLLGGWPRATAQTTAYPWLQRPPVDTIAGRLAPPPGFQRLVVAQGSFAHWLRGLPVKPGRPPVRLHDGRLKENQRAHEVVLDVDVGRRNLQQCADATLRLRAEFLRAAGEDDHICFRFTDGTPASWTEWRDGRRPRVTGPTRRLVWQPGAPRDDSYRSFRGYLDVVFNYAGTFSLARELLPVAEAGRIEAGDLFIQGGFPGHAVIVVDVAEDRAGRRAVLLAQSYMPAQDIHVLRNPGTPDSPWYVVERDQTLVTPEWTFPAGSLRRFSAQGCPARAPR